MGQLRSYSCVELIFWWSRSHRWSHLRPSGSPWYFNARYAPVRRSSPWDELFCLGLFLESFVEPHSCRSIVHAINLGSARIPFFQSPSFCKVRVSSKVDCVWFFFGFILYAWSRLHLSSFSGVIAFKFVRCPRSTSFQAHVVVFPAPVVPSELVSTAFRAATFALSSFTRTCGQRWYLLGLNDFIALDEGRFVCVDDHVEVLHLFTGFFCRAVAISEEGRKHCLAVHARMVDPPWEFNARQKRRGMSSVRILSRCRWV